MDRSDAHEIARRIGAEIGEDFHRLSSSQVSDLLSEADRLKYRKPRLAPGSRGRMFWAYVQRAAARRP